MGSPLANTVRSFWTPETCRDPEWLREVRRDKAIFLIVVGSVLVACAGFTIAGINLAALIGGH